MKWVKRGKLSERGRAMKNLDDYFSLKVRARDGQCMKPLCGKTEGLQCAHIFTRSRQSTRWDMNNMITLCAGHHKFWAHQYPEKFTEWIISRMGKEEYLKLQRKSDMAWHVSTRELELWYKTLINKK
jgi:hypothetical protein